MFKKFFFTSFLFLSSLITIYPSKKENTNFLDYCYSLEKIISRNTVEKNKNLSNNFRPLAKDIALIGTKKTSAQITNYKLDELQEKPCIAVINLGNKQIGPFMSECLVLGSIAENGDVLLLQPSDKAELGDKVS